MGQEFPAMAPEGAEELTDAQLDKQGELKQAAQEAQEDGKLDEALEKLTAAVCVGCPTAMMYAKRAQLLVKLDRPKAAINDCTAALAVNPDSAKAMKIRARLYAGLKQWEEADVDFQTALKIDYDEDTEEDSKEAAKEAKELRTAGVKKRNQDEEVEFQRKLKESGEAYKAGLAARAGDYKEAEEKEKEEKRKTEEERKERVRKREEEAAAAESAKDTEKEADGVPKAHAPPGASAPDCD